MADITKAIQSLCPDAEFVISANDYSTIVWHKIEGDAPTEVKVLTELTRLKAETKAAEQTKAAAKAALLERLGITANEAALLLS